MFDVVLLYCFDIVYPILCIMGGVLCAIINIYIIVIYSEISLLNIKFCQHEPEVKEAIRK